MLYSMFFTVSAILCPSSIWGQETPDVTFAEVAPLFKKNCASCHRPGQMGPMPLTTYDEIRSYGQMIKYVIEADYMPPWLPDKEYATLKNDRRLSLDEKQKIIDWVEGGMQPAKRDSIPLATPERRKKGQQVYCMDSLFEQYSVYMPQFQVFVIPTQFETGVYAKNIHFHPGNSSIVRSCRVSVSPSDKWQKLDDWDPRYGYYSFGGPGAIPEYEGWYEWHPFNEEPPDQDLVRYIPPNSYFIVEIHYGPTGKKQWDQSCLSFDTISRLGSSRIQTAPLVSRLSTAGTHPQLPADQITRIHSSLTLPHDISLLALSPSAHLLCRNWEVYAKTPDGEIAKLLKISDWEKMWAEKYYLETPVHLPAGTEIRALATYDNTAENPYQPADPPINMSWGHGMYNEQFKVTFDFITPPSPRATLITPSSLVTSAPLHLAIQSTAGFKGSVVIRPIHSTEAIYETPISIEKSGLHEMTVHDINLPPGIYACQLQGPAGQTVDATLLFVFEEIDFFKR
jgi:hypothetical protein